AVYLQRAQAPSCSAIGPLCCSLTGPRGVTPPPVAPGRFLIPAKLECRFSNATGLEQVRLLDRDFYLGLFVAVTPLREPDVEYWNSQKEVMQEFRARVDTFCRHSYGVAAIISPSPAA
uniref:MHC class II beta chain N-terminal domain-containing protein n=1 Tax=Varanus komodoensis TaxID=61221 RepID=A0A8D2LBX4_VARKO